MSWTHAKLRQISDVARRARAPRLRLRERHRSRLPARSCRARGSCLCSPRRRPSNHVRSGLRSAGENDANRIAQCGCGSFPCLGTVLAAQSAKVDVTGAWVFTVQSDAGASNPNVTFKQDGEKLTGHYSSMLVGEADLTGSIKAQTIEFTVRADIQGMPFQLKF